MASDRILGSSATIEIYPANGPVYTVEVDSFTATSKHEIKAWHPLGFPGEHNQVIYKGWDLDFKTGKTGSTMSDFFTSQDGALWHGQSAPLVRVTNTIRHFDGTVETWVFPNVVLYGYTADISNAEDEIKESFKGACTQRVPG